MAREVLNSPAVETTVALPAAHGEDLTAAALPPEHRKEHTAHRLRNWFVGGSIVLTALGYLAQRGLTDPVFVANTAVVALKVKDGVGLSAASKPEIVSEAMGPVDNGNLTPPQILMGFAKNREREKVRELIDSAINHSEWYVKVLAGDLLKELVAKDAQGKDLVDRVFDYADSSGDGVIDAIESDAFIASFDEFLGTGELPPVFDRTKVPNLPKEVGDYLDKRWELLVALAPLKGQLQSLLPREAQPAVATPTTQVAMQSSK